MINNSESVVVAVVALMVSKVAVAASICQWGCGSGSKNSHNKNMGRRGPHKEIWETRKEGLLMCLVHYIFCCGNRNKGAGSRGRSIQTSSPCASMPSQNASRILELVLWYLEGGWWGKGCKEESLGWNWWRYTCKLGGGNCRIVTKEKILPLQCWFRPLIGCYWSVSRSQKVGSIIN